MNELHILENGWYKIDFEAGIYPYICKDSIILPPEKYNQLSKDDINALISEKYNIWIDYINNLNSEN
jgi:hypothetical protein